MPSVRSYGVESLAKIMETSLTRLPAIPRRSFSVPSFSSKAQISQILYDMSSVAPTVGTPLDQSPAPSLPIRSPAPAPTPQVRACLTFFAQMSVDSPHTHTYSRARRA